MLPNWTKAVRELLKHAGVTQSALAAEIDESRVNVSRYLGDKRKVPLAVVKRINRFLGRRMNNPEIERYLNAIVGYDAYRGDEAAWDSARDGAVETLIVAGAYLRADYRKGVLDAWPPKEKGVRLLIELNRAWRQRLIRHIDGSTAERVFFDEVLAICGKHGLNLTRWLRPENDVRAERLRDTFTLKVRKALAGASRDIEKRNIAEGQILTAFYEYEFERAKVEFGETESRRA